MSEAKAAQTERTSEARCQDCDAAAKVAYSDATTAGFFSPYCKQHRPVEQEHSGYEMIPIERNLVSGLRQFMLRRFDRDRLLAYQTTFVEALDRVLNAPAEPAPAQPSAIQQYAKCCANGNFNQLHDCLKAAGVEPVGAREPENRVEIFLREWWMKHGEEILDFANELREENERLRKELSAERKATGRTDF